MTTLAERASGILERGDVERLELSRRGELLAQLYGDGEPRWVALTEQGERQLDPGQDSELPLSARLAGLRREQGASVLAWRPGRRMVVRVRRSDLPQGSAVVKALRAGRMRQALERHVEGSRAARAASLAAPEVLAVEPESASFTLSWLGDARVVVSGDRAEAFARLGRALSRFQSEEAGPELAAHGVDAELDVLQELAAKAIKLRGALPSGWERAQATVERALRASAGAASVRTHRDLHDGQLLERDGTLALLDFDLLCRADEALDPANLLAHLELRALQGLTDAAGARACAEAFRAGYGRADDRDRERRLSVWGAASALRLALVYHLRPPYAQLGPVLVGRALARLAEERHGIR